MPIETIITPVGKSDPSFDLQGDIIFGVNGGAKINKFLDCVKSIVIDLMSHIADLIGVKGTRMLLPTTTGLTILQIQIE